MTENEAKELLQVIGKIATYISFLPLIFAFLKMNVFKKKPYIFLFLYFLVGTMLNWFTSWFAVYANAHIDELRPMLKRFEIDDTFFVDPLYFLRNFIFLGAFSYYLLDDYKLKKIIQYFSIFGCLFTIINSIWGETYKEYQTWGSTLDNAFKVFLGIVIIRWIFKSNFKRKLTQIPSFYFAAGFIIIGAFAGLIDFLSNAMFTETSVLFYQIHILKNSFMVLSFLIFTAGIFQIKERN